MSLSKKSFLYSPAYRFITILISIVFFTSLFSFLPSPVSAATSPSPSIISVDYPSGVNLGDYATIRVSAKNNGGEANWQTISISFPQNPSDVTITGSNLGSSSVYWPGSQVWGGYGAGKVNLSYPVVEGSSSPWANGSTRYLEVRVKPPSTGNFVFYVKSVAGRQPDGVCSGYDPSSGTRDQQNEYVRQYSIQIGGGTPSAPSNLSAAATSSTQISLTWGDNSNNEQGFELQRKPAGGSYSTIANPSPNSTSFNDSGLQPNTQYYYRVRAYNNSGSSSFSNETSATTPAGTTSPSPSIISVDYPSGVNLGDYATIRVSAKNNGGEANWQTIAVSFPSNPGDVSISSHSLGSARVHWPGEEMWAGYGSKKVKLSYPVAEGSRSPWTGGSSSYLRVRVKPQSAGNFVFYVKSVAGRQPDGVASSWDPASGTKDQQEEYVATRTISVVQATKPAAVVSGSITTLSSDRSSYETGQQVTVTFGARNTGNTATSYRAVIQINDPSGSVSYDSHPLNQDKRMDLGSGASGTVTFTWTIPSNAPTGTYTILAGLRNWDNWDTVYDYRWGDKPGATFSMSSEASRPTPIAQKDDVRLSLQGINTSVPVLVTADGISTHMQTSAPISLSLASGIPHTVSVPSIVFESSTSRFVASDTNWQFTGSGKRTFVYKPQYLLNASTKGSYVSNSLDQSGWYDAGTSLNLLAPSVQDYVFDYWLLDGVTKRDKNLTIRMDQPHTAVAYLAPVSKAPMAPDTILYVHVATDQKGQTTVTYVPYGPSAEKVGAALWAVTRKSAAHAYETGKQVVIETLQSKWFYIGVGTGIICAAPEQTVGVGAAIGGVVGPGGAAAGGTVGGVVWIGACAVSVGTLLIGGMQVADQIYDNLSSIVANSNDFYLVIEGDPDAIDRLSERIGNLAVNGVEVFLLYEGGKAVTKQIPKGAMTLREGARLQEKATGVGEQVKSNDVAAKPKDVVEQTKETGNDLSERLKERQIAQMGNDIETALNRGTAGKITGFANDAGNAIPHGLERMLGRDGGVGVSDQAVIDAVNNPLKVEPQLNGRTLYSGTNAEVVLDMNGKLVTTWATSRAGYR